MLSFFNRKLDNSVFFLFCPSSWLAVVPMSEILQFVCCCGVWYLIFSWFEFWWILIGWFFQIFALFLRPKKDHKYRFYWNIYHHGVGYAILVLGILNVFKGLNILHPEQKWKSTYITVIAVLGGIALLLEVITWIAVLRRKSNKSNKPCDGYNGQGRQQPFNAWMILQFDIALPSRYEYDFEIPFSQLEILLGLSSVRMLSSSPSSSSLFT